MSAKQVDPVVARVVAIRQRLDVIEHDGFGAFHWPDIIADMRWLLDEHKRLRKLSPPSKQEEPAVCAYITCRRLVEHGSAWCFEHQQTAHAGCPYRPNEPEAK